MSGRAAAVSHGSNSVQIVSDSLFFFQAEDGIRDVAVTGVQTCALPIYTESFQRDLQSHLESLNAPKYQTPVFKIRDIPAVMRTRIDRKSTRLNSSHGYISYAVFCLKKKTIRHTRRSRLRANPARRHCAQ